MFKVYINHVENQEAYAIVVLVLVKDGREIPSVFYAQDERHIERIVKTYSKDIDLFLRVTSFDDPLELPDYKNDPEFLEFTNYYFGNYQG